MITLDLVGINPGYTIKSFQNVSRNAENDRNIFINLYSIDKYVTMMNAKINNYNS